MATFLGRALGLDMVSGEAFSDISDSVHRGYINAVATAGITTGWLVDGKPYYRPARAVNSNPSGIENKYASPSDVTDSSSVGPVRSRTRSSSRRSTARLSSR